MNHLWCSRGAFASNKARQYLKNEFNPDTIKKIAVIRHAALGDQVLVRPFLIEARKFFPQAEITLVSVSNYQYGTPSDLADRTHVMHGKDRKNEITFKQKLENIQDLGEQDIIFDLAATNRSYWMTALNKAKLKMGFPGSSFLARLLYDVTILRPDFHPEVECLLDFLKILGHSPTYPLDFGYPNHHQVVDKEQPYFLYFNGASTDSKTLPKEQMKDLIEDAIKQFPGIKHIFLEGKNESEKAGSAAELSSYGNFAVCPVMELEALIDFSAKATLVIAPDTGVRNVAISTHTPTVGFFYSTIPFTYTPVSGTHHGIVMNASGAIPSNEQIIAVMKKEAPGYHIEDTETGLEAALN